MPQLGWQHVGSLRAPQQGTSGDRKSQENTACTVVWYKAPGLPHSAGPAQHCPVWDLSRWEEQEQGRRSGGGETTVAALRLQHFSGSPVGSCAARGALELVKVKCAVAQQGRPGQACGRSGKEPGSVTLTHPKSPVLHLERTWRRGSRPFLRRTTEARGYCLIDAQN